MIFRRIGTLGRKFWRLGWWLPRANGYTGESKSISRKLPMDLLWQNCVVFWMCTKRAPAYCYQEAETVRRVVFNNVPSWVQRPEESPILLKQTYSFKFQHISYRRLISSVTLLGTENVFFFCPGIRLSLLFTLFTKVRLWLEWYNEWLEWFLCSCSTNT